MDHGTLNEEHALQLRPMEPADAAVFASWGQDADFCRAAGWRAGLSEGHLLAFWDGVGASPPQDLRRLTATLGGVVVGYGDLHGPGPEARALGYLTARSCRCGQCLGTAAVRLRLGDG